MQFINTGFPNSTISSSHFKTFVYFFIFFCRFAFIPPQVVPEFPSFQLNYKCQDAKMLNSIISVIPPLQLGSVASFNTFCLVAAKI